MQTKKATLTQPVFLSQKTCLSSQQEIAPPGSALTLSFLEQQCLLAPAEITAASAWSYGNMYLRSICFTVFVHSEEN